MYIEISCTINNVSDDFIEIFDENILDLYALLHKHVSKDTFSHIEITSDTVKNFNIHYVFSKNSNKTLKHLKAKSLKLSKEIVKDIFDVDYTLKIIE